MLEKGWLSVMQFCRAFRSVLAVMKGQHPPASLNAQTEKDVHTARRRSSFPEVKETKQAAMGGKMAHPGEDVIHAHCAEGGRLSWLSMVTVDFSFPKSVIALLRSW